MADRTFAKVSMDGNTKAIVELLESIDDRLERLVTLVESQGRIRPG